MCSSRARPPGRGHLTSPPHTWSLPTRPTAWAAWEVSSPPPPHLQFPLLTAWGKGPSADSSPAAGWISLCLKASEPYYLPGILIIITQVTIYGLLTACQAGTV